MNNAIDCRNFKIDLQNEVNFHINLRTTAKLDEEEAEKFTKLVQHKINYLYNQGCEILI